MIAKFFGQLILATTLINILPVDAGRFAIVGYGKGTGSNASFEHLLPAPAEAKENYPIKIDADTYGIVTSAPSALIADADTGMILYAKHPDEVRSIGSVTKLMTAMVFLDSKPDLTAESALFADTDLVIGGRIYLLFNDPLSYEEIFGAAMVGSDNTATQALIRLSGMSQEDFIVAMNHKAIDLGMTSTTFTDPTGVNTYNMSTARDLVKLLAAARGYDLIRQYTTTSKLTVTHESGRAITIENTNGLLTSYLNRDPYTIVAGKTGYLPQAGYLLTSAVEKDGHVIYVLVLGAESIDDRELEVKGLATWAFNTFKWPEL